MAYLPEFPFFLSSCLGIPQVRWKLYLIMRDKGSKVAYRRICCFFTSLVVWGCMTLLYLCVTICIKSVSEWKLYKWMTVACVHFELVCE